MVFIMAEMMVIVTTHMQKNPNRNLLGSFAAKAIKPYVWKIL